MVYIVSVVKVKDDNTVATTTPALNWEADEAVI